MTKMIDELDDNALLKEFLTDINYRRTFAGDVKNLTGQSLSHLYFDVDENNVFPIVNIMDIYRDQPDRMLTKELDEDSFIYDKKGNYLEGKKGDFMFEDKLGNQGFIEKEEFGKNYRVDILNQTKKEEMKFQFENASKEKNISSYARKNNFK